MKITLTRLEGTDKGLFGHMDIDGESFHCVTLERHDIFIPVGTYKVTLYNSPKHGLVPLIHDVPGRTMIEIHAGNWENDSLGCILVGRKRVGAAIESSKATLAELVALLKKADEIWLMVK